MRKKFLTIATLCIIFIGVIFVSRPFFGSLNTSTKAINDNTLFVALDKVPNEGFYEVDYRRYKIFIAGKPLRAFKIPIHYQMGYGLPDPRWSRPFTQCIDFVFEYDWFHCKDFDNNHPYSEIAKWDKFGNAIKGSWMPNLETVEFDKGISQITFCPLNL